MVFVFQQKAVILQRQRLDFWTVRARQMDSKLIHMGEKRSMDIYQKLKEIREYKRLSWLEWAGLTGISETGLHKMFRNKSLTVETLQKLCDAIHISPAELFLDEGELAHLAEPQAAYGGKLAKIEAMERLLSSLKSDLHTV
jgi:DNA-binding Xre family transcriptional regulator